MEKYEKAQMEVIEFENEDVITSSSCSGIYNIGICDDFTPPCSGIVS